MTEEYNNLDQLLEEIKKSSELEISDIKRKTAEEIEQLKKECDDRCNEIKERKKIQFNSEGQLHKKQLITEAKLDSQKTVLNEKRAVLDGIFNEILENLKKLDKRDYTTFIEKILVAIVTTGDETVIHSDSETVIGSSLIKKVNKENGWKLKLKPDKKLKSGFILEGDTYKITIDDDAIKEFLSEQMEKKIIENIF